LSAVVAHDNAGFLLFNGPGRREAAGHHRFLTNHQTSKTITITIAMVSMVVNGPNPLQPRVS
jgi:hypothetical protein